MVRCLPRVGRGSEPRLGEGGHLLGREEPVVQPAAVYVPKAQGEEGVLIGVRISPHT